ncbi:MAG: hypothetical protein ACTHQM_00255 [Thermoanaerobaculia bacterium]
MQRALLAISLLLALGAVAAVVKMYIEREQELDAQFVTLRFDRASGLACAICDVHVFVNGVNVGKVPNGKTVKFRFAPATDGRNTIFARLVPAVGPNRDTKTFQFVAREGAVVYARYELDYWVWKTWADMKLDLAIEKHGEARMVNAHPPNPQPNPKKLHDLPWDAIGAIAGVLGVVVAVVALFK